MMGKFPLMHFYFRDAKESKWIPMPFIDGNINVV